MTQKTLLFSLFIGLGFFGWSCGSDDNGEADVDFDPSETSDGGAAGQGDADGGTTGDAGMAGEGGTTSAGTGGSVSAGTAGAAGSSETAGAAGSAGADDTAGAAGAETAGAAGAAAGAAGAETAGAAGAGGVEEPGGTAGAGGTGAVCSGTVRQCGSLPLRQCGTVLGCEANIQCTGEARACNSADNRRECNAIPGCEFERGGCTGTPDDCSSIGQAILDCQRAGCDWGECTGTATECSMLDASECTSQPGCSLE